MEPVQFLRRLAAILPPPRQNQVRFHGIFASGARDRAGLAALLPPSEAPAPAPTPAAPADVPAPRARKLLWSQLLRRVFSEDVLVCPRCEGPMRLIAVLTDREIVGGILRHLGLPDTLPVAPARAPPQAELFAPDPPS